MSYAIIVGVFTFSIVAGVLGEKLLNGAEIATRAEARGDVDPKTGLRSEN